MSESRRVPAFENRAFTEQWKSKSRRRRAEAARAQEARVSSRPPRNDLTPALVLIDVPIENLRLPSRRVRKAEQAHVQEVARSIATLGFSTPVIVGKDNLVLDGAIRIEAAKLLGLTRVPCIRVDHLDESEQRLFRLAANRLGEKGEWNLDALKIEFEELILHDAPIEVSGFALDEIDHILIGDEVSAAEAGPLEPEPGAVAVAQHGDIFALGPHRFICGSATDLAEWLRLMDDGAQARLFLTDEPFNARIAGHVSGTGHREFVMALGEMSDAEFFAFNHAFIEMGIAHLVDGGVLGTFIDWRGLPIANAAATKLGLSPIDFIVLAKANADRGSLYPGQHELLPLFKKGSAPHVSNVERGKCARPRSNIWSYPGATSGSSDARRSLKDHPTVKPTAMLEDALLDLTNRGDIVLDPFLGSGSTLIAAHNTGRICRGHELDPLYADVIVRRFEAATGIKAKLVATGETFAEVAERRARERANAPLGATPPAVLGDDRASPTNATA